VVRIARAETLGEHVLHAGDLEHRAHAGPGDDAGSRRRRLQEHLARAEVTDDHVRHRAALRDRDAEQVLLRGLTGLADRVRNFVGLAETDSDLSLAVADRDDRVEREAPAALHHLGAAVHLDDALGELRLRSVGPTGAAASTLLTILLSHRSRHV